MAGVLHKPSSALNQEGFLCPICVQDLGSASALSEHFNSAHSGESNDVLDQVKGFFGKAKKFFNIDQEELNAASGGVFVDTENRSRSSSARMTHSYFLEPQEFGKTRKHTGFFKSMRDAAVDRSLIEGNKIIIRLSKLTSDNTPEEAAKRKVFEQKIVPWEDDKSVKTCSTCGKSFNLRRRRHHCRLCGGIMCDNCSEFLPISQASMFELLGLSASVDSGLAIGQTPPTFLRRRGSNSSLSSLGSQETGPTLRMCTKCRKILESHQKRQEQKFSKPEIMVLYERIQELREQTERITPEYSKMALSLRAGETVYSLDKASALRNQIAKLYSSMEGASKRITTLGAEEEGAKVSDKQTKLRMCIRAYTLSYIQEQSGELPKLPDETEFKSLISQREEQRKRKVEQELRQAQQREQQRLAAQAKPTVQPQAQISNSNQPAVPKPADPKPAPQGWKPGEVDSRLVEDSDPMVQQMNIIRGYLKQATAAQRWDEVEMLEENLRTLEEEFYNLCDTTPKTPTANTTANKTNSSNPFL